MRKWLTGLALVATLAGAAPAFAQDPVSQDEDRVEDVVVIARRAGAPMWTITRGDSTLIVVGAVEGLPRDLEWRPEALEAAASRSQRILFPQEMRASAADIARLIWRARTAVMLPGQETVAAHVSASDMARLEPIMATEGPAWRRKKLLLLSFDLLEQAGYRQRNDLQVSDVVRRAGRRAGAPIRPIGLLHGDDFVEMLISSPQSQHRDCFEAAILAAEAGPDTNNVRADDWRHLRVAAVVANPLERAIARCWPYADPQVGIQIAAEWVAAIDLSLSEPGVTMAVAPLTMLVQTGGVLDRLEAEGVDILGPDWKVVD
jgi:hypothetical protein